jgi:hypothetical protein
VRSLLSDLLPGLWVAALAGLLAGALRRWFDPIPRRCWIFWGAALLVLFGAALFGGRVLLPLGYLVRVPPFTGLWDARDGPPPGDLLQSDLVLQITPWLVRVREAFAAGEWPLWNHLAGAGEPLLGNPQTQVLQPLVWLAFPFSAAAGTGVTAALRVLTALVFTFLFLRRQGLSELPALGSSLAYGLGAGLLLWLNWPMGNSPALLPLVLYGVALVDERGLRRDQALLAAAVAALLCAGHPETILHIALLAGALALARLRTHCPGKRRRVLLAWAAAAAVGAGLTAPALLPAAAFLPQTLRVSILEQQREQRARDVSLAVLDERLLPIAAPNAFGSNRFGSYWGESNANEDAGAFVGTIALLAAVLAAVAGGRRRLPQERLALLATLVALLVLARPPGLPRLLTALPVLRDSLTLHHRLLLTLGFCLAWLAGCTWERWIESGMDDGRARRRIALSALGLAVLLIWAYAAHPAPAGRPPLAGLRELWLLLQLAALAAGALLLSLRLGKRRALAGGLLAVCVGAELLIFHVPLNPPVPARLFYPVVPPVAFLRAHLGAWYRMSGLGPALRANVPSVYGLADPRTSNPTKPAAFAAATVSINRFPSRATDGFAEPFDHLYPLLGVQYLMTAPDVDLPRPWRLAFADAGARVWEHPRPIERLFLPRATVGCPGGTPWADCLRLVGSFRNQAVLTAGDAVPPGTPPETGTEWRAADPHASRLDLLELHPAWLRARVFLAEPRLLATSIYQEGGWRVLLAGRPQPMIQADGPFAAAWLPAGAGDLELIYRPRGFVAGMLLAALALTAAAVLWTPPPGRGRKHSAAPGPGPTPGPSRLPSPAVPTPR